MDVLVVAEDPIESAVTAGLEDADVSAVPGTTDDLAGARFGVVGAVTGDGRLERANAAALGGSTPWVAVEVGGVGGRPLEGVDAAVTGFAPDRGCYRCLEARLAATGVTTADRPAGDRSAARLAGAVAAHETVRLFAGADPSIVGHVVEVPHARRRVLPVPGCRCAEARERSLGRDAETAPLETTVERCEAAIDERVGIVTGIGEVASFPAPYYLASLADTAPMSDRSGPTEAAGVDPDWNAALVKATGEALERYAAAIYREDTLPVGPATEIDDAVGPGRFVRTDPSPVDETDPIRWVDGEHLASGDPVSLPASVVHFPPPAPAVRPGITTGLGLGTSTVDALVAGLTEVIERDAAMIAWYSTHEPVGLRVEAEVFQTLRRRADSEGLSVTALECTLDIDVPTVAVAVHRDPDDGDGPWPHFAAGTATAIDGEVAAVSALCEALQNWMELRELGPDAAAAEASGAIAEYGDAPAVVREFVATEPTTPAASLGHASPPAGPDRLAALVSAVTDAGLEPYAASLTTRDLRTLGFEAVRVVVPGAQPLFTREPFFGDRARSVPRAVGAAPRLEAPFHPFP